MIPYRKQTRPSSKYKSVITENDGIKFHSKLEAAFYERLKRERELGRIKYFLRQTPIHLPANIKYVVDFLVIDNLNNPHYLDIKGFLTSTAKMKIKMAEDIYKIEIKLIKSITQQYLPLTDIPLNN